MNLHASTLGGHLLIEVEDDRIDASVAIRFKDRVRELARDSSGPVLLDLAQVGFLDSSGLGAIVAIRKLLGNERPLGLIGVGGMVEKVFRLTRMDSVFPIYPDRASALAAPPAPDLAGAGAP